MTSVLPKPRQRGNVVYGQHGQPIATVSQSRSEYLSSLLAECDRGHIYLLPNDPTAWLSADAVCLRCRILGLVPGDLEVFPHGD